MLLSASSSSASSQGNRWVGGHLTVLFTWEQQAVMCLDIYQPITLQLSHATVREASQEVHRIYEYWFLCLQFLLDFKGLSLTKIQMGTF